MCHFKIFFNILNQTLFTILFNGKIIFQFIQKKIKIHFLYIILKQINNHINKRKIINNIVLYH